MPAYNPFTGKYYELRKIKPRRKSKKSIDDNNVLNSYYDSRTVFVVEFDPYKVIPDLTDVGDGTIKFKLKEVEQE